MSTGVVVVGSFNVDHAWTSDALPRPGETLAGLYASGAGGKGFNQAVAAARAGAATTFVCALGDDSGGRLARDLAAADGIALHAQGSDAPTGTAGIFIDARGRNCIVLGPGANAELSVAHLRAHRADISAARILVAQLEVPPATVEAALQAARDAGVATVLNPAPANIDVAGGLVSLADVLTPNETEFASLLAHHLGERIDPDEVAMLEQARLHDLCRALLPHGTVVVTLGSAGCFVSHPAALRRGDDRPHYRTPGERVQAIDTTGAGDAFNGALAASLARAPGKAFEGHIVFATRYAALSTERTGAAASMPRRPELESRYGG
ncbi:ribokinase [Luteimonas vadosa]|uniref:Ribokinase n=1 Tax=Luteimonas vadosa TaxID=1165507 RepID=A0ABP9DYE4_9GAMM